MRADSVSDSNHEMSCVVKCSLISKRRTKFTFGCFHGWPNHPILVIERSMESEDENSYEWIKIYQSNVCDDTIEPTFRKLAIKMQRLCNGNKNMPLQWSVWSQVNEESRKMYG